jgi:hypothetical protein
MKPLVAIALFAATAALAQTSQTSAPQSTTQEAASGSQAASITVSSSLVIVPALVRAKSGQLIYTLKANDFILTDDGIEQNLRLEENTGDQPLALVIVVETGASGAAHLDDYRNLAAMLDSMVGRVEHKVAVVGFDSTPTLLHGFTPNLDFITHSLNELDKGDEHAAILDALTFSVDLLRKQPTNYRRAILLFSETIDQGSHTRLEDALRAISDTNTAIYSIGFSSTKAELGNEATKFGFVYFPPLPPGPKHGCFSRDLGTDAEGNPIKPTESSAAQNLNCIEEVLPPLRLARLAEIAAGDSLHQNISAAVATLTGGESFKFKDATTLKRDLFAISNHIPNRYVLSFHPRSPQPGFHSITLHLRDYPDLSVEARKGYWVEGEQLH